MAAPEASKTYGDSKLTADDIAALPEYKRQEYLEQYMSPQDRTNYLKDSANAKYANDPAFVSWFEGIAANAKAQDEANKYSQQSAQQATSANTQYVTGLAPSNTNYKAIDHTDLQGYVENGLSAGQVGEMSTGYHEMSSTFSQIATTLNEAVNKSQSEWEGNAADSARGFFTSLQQWSDGNSQNARLASEVTYQQSTAAATAKNSMPAPVPFNWNDEMKDWFSNPFTVADKIQGSMEKAQQSQQAHDQAVQVMSTYDNNLFTAASKQPVFAEPPKFEPPGSVDTGQLSGNVNSTQASGYAGQTGSGSGGGGGGGYSGPSGGGGAGSVSGALGGPLSAGAMTGSNSTRAQGYQPPGLNSPSSSNNGPNPQTSMAGPPMMPMMGGGGMGGGDESYSGRSGRGGGFGPGGSGSGAGGGAGSAASEGARTGIRAGGAGAAEAAGAAGSRGGAAGGRGASGMGGTGGARGGQGSEDEEHQRPSWLVEADPDEVFGTSERTAPPVIGE